MNKFRGFTVIELLVIIVIIGVLASLGLFGYRNMFRMGQEKEVISRIQKIYQRTHMFAVREGENFIFEINKTNNFIRSAPDTASTKTEDSIKVDKGFVLDYPGSSMSFRVKANGNVEVIGGGNRNFNLVDVKENDTVHFYISQLGIMEVK